MLTRILAILALSIGTAHATPPNYQYIVGTGATPCASLQAANHAYAQAVGTDATTPYWFPLIVLTNGSCAIKIVPGDQYYGTTLTLPASAKFPSGLTITLSNSNISALNVALATRASLAGILPDVLTLAAFQAVLTTAQINYLNGLTSGTVYNYWQTVKTGGSLDMADPTYQSIMSGFLANSQITQAQYNTLTTPAVTTMGP
jgi:hypothetical protein